MTETTNTSAEMEIASGSIQAHDEDDTSFTAAQAQQRSLSEETNNEDSLIRNHSLMDGHDDDSDDEQNDGGITSNKHSSAVFVDETTASSNDGAQAQASSKQAARGSTAVASLFSGNRRHTISNATPLQQPQRWDHFVRSGTRLKTLLEDAMTEVKTSIVSARVQKRRRDIDEDEGPDASRARVVAVADFTAELAREKTAQVLQLQRQLKDAQAQAAAMQAANASLREETASSQSRLERTVDALRIAGSNAAKARADADAAEATAATLAQTLQSLQSVITETKRASQILHKEQQQVTATVANVEAKLLQKEGDLVRAQKELMKLRQSNAVLENSHDKWKDERELLERQLKQYQQELSELKREKWQQIAVELARKDRADKVEQEWCRAQSMLVEATSGQAASEHTQAVLQETLASLQKANQDLHATLKEQQTAARGDNQRLTEALGKVEKEAQRLRIAAEASEEEMQRMKIDKAAADKQIQELKNRLAASLKESSAAAAASTVASSATNSTISPETTTPANNNNSSAGLSFHLPPLATGKQKQKAPSTMTTTAVTDKENKGVENGDLCCICFKQSLGIMKTCQCGDKECRKKAHANCVKLSAPGPSVSHPCTPAPKLPVVLCGSVMSKLTAARHHSAAAAAAATASKNA